MGFISITQSGKVPVINGGDTGQCVHSTAAVGFYA